VGPLRVLVTALRAEHAALLGLWLVVTGRPVRRSGWAALFWSVTV